MTYRCGRHHNARFLSGGLVSNRYTFCLKSTIERSPTVLQNILTSFYFTKRALCNLSKNEQQLLNTLNLIILNYHTSRMNKLCCVTIRRDLLIRVLLTIK